MVLRIAERQAHAGVADLAFAGGDELVASREDDLRHPEEAVVVRRSERAIGRHHPAVALREAPCGPLLKSNGLPLVLRAPRRSRGRAGPPMRFSSMWS